MKFSLWFIKQALKSSLFLLSNENSGPNVFKHSYEVISVKVNFAHGKYWMFSLEKCSFMKSHLNNAISNCTIHVVICDVWKTTHEEKSFSSCSICFLLEMDEHNGNQGNAAHCRRHSCAELSQRRKQEWNPPQSQTLVIIVVKLYQSEDYRSRWTTYFSHIVYDSLFTCEGTKD